MANQPKKQRPVSRGLGNFAVGDKLKNISSHIKTRRDYDDVKKVTDLGPDGEDHINVYSNCKTELGKALSPFEIKPFIHPLYGKFNSRQGFYYYLLSKDGHEAFRTMPPTVKMSKYAANLPTMGFFAVNLRYFMAEALWYQIKDNETVKQQLIDNQLPFEAYYLRRQKFDDTVSLIPSRPNANAQWITRIVTVIANALKANTVPNFDEFIDDKEQLEKLKAKIMRPLTPPPAPKPKKEKVKKEVVTAEAKVEIPPGIEDDASLPVEEGMQAVEELRDALNVGSNGTSIDDLANTSIAPYPGEGTTFTDPLVQINTNCVLGQEPEVASSQDQQYQN